LIGASQCVFPFWQNAPGVYMMWIRIDAAWQRRGIGRAVLAKIEAYARQQGANKIRTDCREDQDYSIGFLKAMDFINFGLRYESELDLNAFDESKFGDVIDQAIANGYEFTTLAAERAIEPEADRLLYEVGWRTTLDVPIPGSTFSKPTFENFRALFLDGPDNDASGILIAKRNGQYVGHTIVMLLPDRPAYTRMTGVLREHRGHDLALVLKLLSFRLMKERGYTLTRTTNDTANSAILRLNEKLGYQRLPGFMLWEKVL
jgi:GNAT superfamily N-acetyltransferase